MMSPCDDVGERLAVGQPLAELTAHAEDCPRCQGLLAVQRTLAATGTRGEPAQGFSSRMTVVANQRLVTRHRRRIVGYAALSAAAAALTTFALVREPSRADDQIASTKLTPPAERPENDQAAASNPAHDDPWKAETPDEPALEAPDRDDDETRALYVLSRTYATPVSANWREIEAPLQPYDRLLQQVADR